MYVSLYLTNNISNHGLPIKAHENTVLSMILWKLAQNDNTLLQCHYFEQNTWGGEHIRLDEHIRTSR